MIAALGPFDVGQAVVVADGHVLGIEAAEGTDNLLARIGDLRGQGRVTTPPGVGVLVKAPKPGQDRRFDLPAIGPQTVENVARAGLAGLAVTAGSTIVAEPAQLAAAADRAKIFVVGVPEGNVRMNGRSRGRCRSISSRRRNPATRSARRWRMRSLSARRRASTLAGVGGRAMAAAGIASPFPIDDLAIVGFSAIPRPAADDFAAHPRNRRRHRRRAAGRAGHHR